MSNTVGVGAITVTADDQVLLQRRAKWTGEWAGLVDRPGGHPEPGNVKTVAIKHIDFLLHCFLLVDGKIHFKVSFGIQSGTCFDQG